MRRQTAHEIDAAAAQWAARADRGLSSEEEQALDAWLAEDSRRAGAYARARAVALNSERARALGPDYDPRRFRPEAGRPSRRGVFIGGGSLLAAGAAGVTAYKMGLLSGDQRFNTRRGEVRVVPLGDGSVITLNTASRVSVAFSGAERRVRLLEGEALFDVAKDAARPFLVEAGDTVVRAVGTSFTVRRIADAPVQVLVREGVVEVKRRTNEAAPVRIAANMRAVAPQTAVPVRAIAVPPAEVGRELAWREGRIAFEGETLEQAAKEFGRYSDTQIIIEDPAIAREEVTGLFQANDPVGFAQAVASSFELRADVEEGRVRLHR